MPRFSRIAPLCALLALPLGCGRDLPGLFSTKAETLRVSPARFGLYLGQSFQFDVIRDRAEDSTSVLRATDLTLSVDDPALVELGDPGLARAIAAGSTVLHARIGGLTAEAALTIFPAELASLEVSPSSLTLMRGQSAPLTVLGRLTDGSTVDLTLAASGTIYRSSNDAIATVGPNGLVTGVADGGATIEIIHGGITVVVRAQVGDDQAIVGLVLRPERTSLEFGSELRLDVIGLTAAGAEIDLRPAIANLGITFSSSEPRVATVNGQAVVTAGQVAGVALVNATYGALQATSEVRVRPPANLLVGIEARPPFLTTAIQSSAQLTIIGIYSDGAIADLTLAAAGTTYVSENDRLLTVTADGLVRSGTTEGSALIVVRNGGFETVVFVEIVAESRLDFIQVTPNPVTMRVSSPVQLMVTAFYSDGRIEDVTRLGATFRATGAVTVTGGGLLRASRTGTGQVDVTFMGMVVSVPVTVTDAQVVNIFIDPPFISVLEGDIFFNVTVFAELSDGRIVPLNGDPGLAVRVEDPNIAGWIGNGVQGFQRGFTALIATYQGFRARADIEVIGGGGQVVAILILAPAQMMVGAVDNFAVIGFLSDGTAIELTNDPGLSLVVSGPFVTIMGNSIFAQSVGRATITATYQGFQDTADVLVQSMPDPVVSIAFVPSSLSLVVGGSAVVRLEATLASGQRIDITWDMTVNYTGNGPIVGFPDPGGIRIEATGVGAAFVQAEYQGHVTTLNINITNGMVVVIGLEIRASPTVPLGGTGPYQVLATYSDGSIVDVTSDPGLGISVAPPGIIGAANGTITGLAQGQATLTARFQGQVATRSIQVVGLPPPPPFIASIVPNAIAVGSMTVTVTLTGSGFSPGDTVFVNGAPVMTGFGSATTLQAQISSTLLTMPRTLSVQVIGPNGASNTVTITVGTPPNVTSFFPSTVVAGSSVEVTAVGSGLTGLTFSGAGLTYVLLSSAPDGTSVRFRVSAPANTPAGPRTVTLTNPFGSTNIVMQVVSATNQMDLVVNAGQTIMLGGTHVYANITVQTGGRIIASGVEPLVLISTGNITVRGTIDANGRAGDQGFTNPAPGGAAGSGGGGGGGGGDGNGNPPAVGGAGSPAGGTAAIGSGAGTRGGNGGGTGGGIGANGGCGQAGGGGGFAGAGGRGGGDAGPGTGGVGGAAGSSGSTFGAGTGGGGGSTCGNNSGGGGGGGGGMVVLQAAFAGTLLVDGALSADGGNGGDGFNGTGGGGGGSGGRIELRAPSGAIVVNDTIHVRGGGGGASDFGDTGGGGGGGIIRIDASPSGTVNVGLGLLDASGGNFGASLGAGNAGRAGGAGQITVLP